MAAFGAALDALQHTRGPPPKRTTPTAAQLKSNIGATPIMPPGGTGKISRSAFSNNNSNSSPLKSGGRFDFDDGGTYCGGWNAGKADGFGVCTGPKGKGEFSGIWRLGFELSGIYTWPNGYTYEGDWQGGKRHGLGLETRARWIYAGEWTAGLKGRYGIRVNLPTHESNVPTTNQDPGTGIGLTNKGAADTGLVASIKTIMAASATEASAAAKYEGTWANGLQDGYGTETYADGSTFQGQFLRGVRHGYGVRKSVPYGLASAQRTMLPLPVLGYSDDEDKSSVPPFWERDRRLEVRGGFVLKSDCTGGIGLSGSRGKVGQSGSGNGLINDILNTLKVKSHKIPKMTYASHSLDIPDDKTRGSSLDRTGENSMNSSKGSRGLRQTLRKALSSSSHVKLATSVPDVVFVDATSSRTLPGTSTVTSFKQKIIGNSSSSKQKHQYPLKSSESVDSAYSIGSAPPSYYTSGLDKDNRLQHLDSNLSFVSQDDIIDQGITETYSGEWKNDKRSGFGICERSDGLRYEGEWLDNKKHGYGVTCLPDGSRLAGKYKGNIIITSYPTNPTSTKSIFRSFSPHSSSNSLHNIANTAVGSLPSGVKNTRKKSPTNPFYFLTSRTVTKLKEKVDNAVSHALRAAGLSTQKAEIAAVRKMTAQEKAQQAETAAIKARNNSDLARLNAKKYAPDFHQPGTEFLKKRLRDRALATSFNPDQTNQESTEIYGNSGRNMINRSVQTKDTSGRGDMLTGNGKKGSTGGILKGIIKRSRSLYVKKSGTAPTSIIPTTITTTAVTANGKVSPLTLDNGSRIDMGQYPIQAVDAGEGEEYYSTSPSRSQRSRTGSEDVTLSSSRLSSYEPFQSTISSQTTTPPSFFNIPVGKTRFESNTSQRGSDARAGLIEGSLARGIKMVKPEAGKSQFYDHYTQYVEPEALDEVPKNFTASLDRSTNLRSAVMSRGRSHRSDTLPAIITTQLPTLSSRSKIIPEISPVLEENGQIPKDRDLESEIPEDFSTTSPSPSILTKKWPTELVSSHLKSNIAERVIYSPSVPSDSGHFKLEEVQLQSPPIMLTSSSSSVVRKKPAQSKVLMIRPPLVVSGGPSDQPETSKMAATTKFDFERKEVRARNKTMSPIRKTGGSLPDICGTFDETMDSELWSRDHISQLSSQRRRELNRIKEESINMDASHKYINNLLRPFLSKIFGIQSSKSELEFGKNINNNTYDVMKNISHDFNKSEYDIRNNISYGSKIMVWLLKERGIIILIVFNICILAAFYHLLFT